MGGGRLTGVRQESALGIIKRQFIQIQTCFEVSIWKNLKTIINVCLNVVTCDHLLSLNKGSTVCPNLTLLRVC